jgi:ribosome-associated toxin RatA of RatAB toxin-antitoxin module
VSPQASSLALDAAAVSARRWQRPHYVAAMAVSDSLTVTVNAPADQVLAFLRDVDNQKNWFPGNPESEVLERGADGFPSTARLVNDVKVAKDEFFLVYTHNPNGFSWTMREPSKAQKEQNGSWTVTDKGGKCDVTFALSIDSSLPLPGFVQKSVLKDTLKGATKALAKQF